MKTIQPRRVRISAFDFHPFLAPLADPNLFTSAFRFMAKPESYAAFFKQPHLQAPGLAVRPLRRVELEASELRTLNHFWPGFRQAAGPAGRVFLPLVCTPPGNAAAFRVDDPAVRAHARGRAWLWPFGWSSQVTVSLDHPLTLGELRVVMAALGDAHPFHAAQVGPEPFGLTRFLRWLGRQVTSAVYAEGEAPSGPPAFTRSLVVSLEDFAEMPDRTSGSDFYDGLPSGELERLHSALLGTRVNLPARGEGFTSTLFKRAGAAITYFERPGSQEGWRTLLLLDPGLAAGVDTRCLGENVMLASLTAQVLLVVGSIDPAGDSAGEEVAGPLVEEARKVLLRLRKSYGNPFVLDLENHTVISAWREAQAAKPAPG